MNKKILIVMAAAMVAGNANAGLLDSLLGKKSEPKTLQEACNKDDIKKICPEMLLDGMTMSECLIKNISELSDQCATFIKKSATDKITDAKQAVVGKIDAQKADNDAKSAETKTMIGNQLIGTKAEIEAKIAEKKAQAAARQAESDAKKAAAAETAAATKDAVNETVESAKKTGQGLVNLFK